MAKTMKFIALTTALMTIIFALLYKFTDRDILLTFAITFGTIAYHFIMRLIIGGIIDLIMKNKADYTKRWYRVGETEMKFYKKIGVKKWKNKMPTYNNDFFDTNKHSWDEIIGATCQSELVHEIIIVFSFLPIIATVWFGAFWVFVITSVCAAIYDMIFVFMQRFNRSRILKMKTKLK
ncbi:MAG: hypothetical protein IKK32_01650 [Oscillospiraceae bacterium]|nr:hypothetical protein [Oscillospiraceae bacterium]